MHKRLNARRIRRTTRLALLFSSRVHKMPSTFLKSKLTFCIATKHLVKNGKTLKATITHPFFVRNAKKNLLDPSIAIIFFGKTISTTYAFWGHVLKKRKKSFKTNATLNIRLHEMFSANRHPSKMLCYQLLSSLMIIVKKSDNFRKINERNNYMLTLCRPFLGRGGFI